jgi:hypothetical protein
MFINVAGSPYTALNGTYAETGLITNGKKQFNLVNGTYIQVIEWNSTDNSWNILAWDGSVTFYSVSDVVTPDLATNWIDNTTSEPAIITVNEIVFPDLKVSSAGVTKVNSCYSAVGITEGKPSYKKIGTFPTTEQVTIEFSGESWELYGEPPYEGGVIPRYYSSAENVDTPDLCITWITDKDGVEPLPTITIGCTSSYIPQVCKAVKRNRG